MALVIGSNMRSLLWMLAVSVSFIFGCGSGDSGFPPTYPVTGTVTLNGKAVDGATVTFFLTEGKGSAVGSTGADGKYSLSTFRPGDGAVAGQYKVSIAKYSTAVPSNPTTPPQGQIASGDIDASNYAPPSTSAGKTSGSSGAKNSLPAKYANADFSGLRAAVSEKGKNEFNFDLK